MSTAIDRFINAKVDERTRYWAPLGFDWCTCLEVNTTDKIARVDVEGVESWQGFGKGVPTVGRTYELWHWRDQRWLKVGGVSWCKTWTLNADWDAGARSSAGATILYPATDDELKLTTEYGFGDGRDGAVANTGLSYNLNTQSASGRSAPDAPLWPVLDSMNDADRTYVDIPEDVRGTGKLALGDLVVLICMQGPYVPNVGNREIFSVKSLSWLGFGTRILLDRPRDGAKWYGYNPNTDKITPPTGGASSLPFVQRVPQYSSWDKALSGGTITVTPWNGFSGIGAVWIYCQGGMAGGAVDVRAKGYAGGPDTWDCDPTGGNVAAYGGESVNGTNRAPPRGVHNNHSGGAGGHWEWAPCATECGGGGGGGGGYATAGGKGAYGGHRPSPFGGFADDNEGGDGSGTYGVPSLLDQIFLGSGGGAAGALEGDGFTGNSTGAGGEGGGIIEIHAASVGNILLDARGGHGHGIGAGSGAGGSVFLVTDSAGTGTRALADNGDPGGSASSAFCHNGEGGAGGDGRIHVRYRTSIAGLSTDITPYTDQYGVGEACLTLGPVDMQDYAGTGALGLVTSLLSDWALDGDLNAPPKYRVFGSDDSGGAVNVIAFPSASTYYQDGTAHDIDNGAALDLSEIDPAARRYWWLTICLDQIQSSGVTPSVQSAELCGLAF